jgi:hypothetical protein
MGRDTKVTCDQCAHDLTYTGNCEDWRLVLDYEAQEFCGGAVTSMAISPPLNRAYIFCGLGCLASWLATKHPTAIESYDRLMKHRASQVRDRDAQ